MEKNYEKFFEDFKKFKEKQDKQKMRGLNNYNILTSVLDKSDEVRLHSRMIFSLLNPIGKHYQGTLFLEKFISGLKVEQFNINIDNCSIRKEYKNIDLYITDGNKHIIVENKIDAKDQENQIKRYIDVIQEKGDQLSENDILVVYLSLDREVPSVYSLDDLKIMDEYIERNEKKVALFKSIHYKEEMLTWLKSCQEEIQNITNLNEVFNQYIDVVNMINYKYKGKIMSVSSFINKNKANYEMANEIRNNFLKSRKDVIEPFFNNVIDALVEKLDEKWIVKMEADLSNKGHFPLRIYKNEWIDNEERFIIFGFEFDSNDYYSGQFGIVRRSDKVDIKDISKEFKKDLNELIINRNEEEWWLHKIQFPNDSDSRDFAKYVMFSKNPVKEFSDAVEAFIRKFEIKSNLITRINSDLKNKK